MENRKIHLITSEEFVQVFQQRWSFEMVKNVCDYQMPIPRGLAGSKEPPELQGLLYTTQKEIVVRWTVFRSATNGWFTITASKRGKGWNIESAPIRDLFEQKTIPDLRKRHPFANEELLEKLLGERDRQRLGANLGSAAAALTGNSPGFRGRGFSAGEEK